MIFGATPSLLSWNRYPFTSVSVRLSRWNFVLKGTKKTGLKLKLASWAISIFERKPVGLLPFCGTEKTFAALLKDKGSCVESM